MAFHSIISSRLYSPLGLGHLPQPVPNDLPADLDPRVFTFQDAFEDLLAASRGQDQDQDQKLPDIRSRHQQRQLLWNMFPRGEPAWFWLRRLESQGLLDARPRLDPFALVGSHHHHLPPGWPALHPELPRADPWPSVSSAHKGEEDTAASGGGGLWQKLTRAIMDVERELFRDGDKPQPWQDDDDDEEARRVDARKLPQGGRFPRHFDDLFSEISSSFKETQSSWDTFIENVVRGATTGPAHDERQSPSPLADRDRKDVLTSEEEHVDQFGYLHKTVTRKTLDAEGREVGFETYVAIRPADKHDEDNVDREGGGNNQQGLSESRKSAQAFNWFWK
ncbi:hypothetical protein E4U41_003950 [Claviceps citrina]|nr:hypothetical protein E4U41_003950 [Claviceps citrina]